MSLDTLFTIANISVLPVWLLLAVAPRWIWTQRIAQSIFPPLLLGGAYAWLFATGSFFGSSVPEGGGFGSLSELMVLFSYPNAVLAGWLHYLAFDLFVGAWIVRDAQRRNVNHLLVVPCLILTLMVGPVGLILYLILRIAVRKGGIFLDETP